MLTEQNIREFTKKFQTIEKNVIREYIQHIFLLNLYKVKNSDKLLFKGGTALRIIYQSPRFSEDLDFTGHGIFRHEDIDAIFLETLTNISQAGINVSYEDAKPTSGGYLGVIHCEIFGSSEDMKFEVSLRKGQKVNGEVTSIVADFCPPYTLIHMPAKLLVDGKMNALLDRKKPRDYYDLYFMLRHPELNKFINKKTIKRVMKNLNEKEIDFKRELSVILPVSHHALLKDFKSILRKEIAKYLI